MYGDEEGFTSAWSIYDNPRVTTRYQILDHIGSGAYSDVYHAIRRQDGLHVALKEVHDGKSSIRELKALQLLQNQPNVVQLLDFIWMSPGILLVLEFLPGSLSDLIDDYRGRGLPDSEARKLMEQILTGVAACHAMGVLHRDLKPSNLLLGRDGVLKVADFGTSRIVTGTKVTDSVAPRLSTDHEKVTDSGTAPRSTNEKVADFGIQEDVHTFPGRRTEIQEWLEGGTLDTRGPEESRMHASASYDRLEITTEADTDVSPRVSDVEEEEDGSWEPDEENGSEQFAYPREDAGEMTDCVGTRWYKAPELLYGSTDYSHAVDLWAVGCILGEMFIGEPLFPGASDIDQLSRVVRVFGVPDESSWPGISELPDYDKICFSDDRKPVTLAGLLRKVSDKARRLTEKLLVYHPGSRVSASEALLDEYFLEAGDTTGPSKEHESESASKEAVESWLKMKT